MTKLAAGEDYHGRLLSGYYRFNLFRIMNPGKVVTKVSFSQCVGKSSFAIIQNQDKLQTRVVLDVTDELGMRIGIVHNLPGENYILVEAFSAELNA